MTKIIVALMLILSIGQMAFAQVAPNYKLYQFSDNAVIKQMSDNGKYAVAGGVSTDDSTIPLYAKYINLETGNVTELTKYSSTLVSSISATDVTDDGNIVVGSINDRPAYINLSAATPKWEELPTIFEWSIGEVTAITPDGKWAVGSLGTTSSVYKSHVVMWNMETLEVVELQGLPTKDMAHNDMQQNMFKAISADGRYILGVMSYSYLPTSIGLGGCFFYVYDVANSTYTPIGFKESDTERWTPLADNLFVITEASMSNNGKYVTGFAHIVNGSEEYDATFVYNTGTKKFEVYNSTSEDNDMVGFAIDNHGHSFSATPANSPFRELYMRNGNYWYGVRMLLKQKYNYDFVASSGFESCGTPIALSDDGKTLVAMADPYSSYVLKTDMAYCDATEGFDLLGNYTVNPAANSSISRLATAVLTFDREVKVLGASTCAQIRDSSGATVYSSVGVSAEGNKVTVRFRKGYLEEAGAEYSLYLPAGAIAMASDLTQSNKEISIKYIGRASEPMKPLSITPEANSKMPKFDASVNPVMMTFDANVQLTDSASARLMRPDENIEVCRLALAYSGKQVAIYPAIAQYLYMDTEYQVVIDAGSITDAAGNNANEEITVSYIGSYERQVSYGDKYLYKEDFSAGMVNVMTYDNDHNPQGDLAKEWQFTDEYGWSVILESAESYDWIAASHSQYANPGKSDDWMVTPQIYIPDDKCVLSFLSQSYDASKTDRLKVIVVPKSEPINNMNSDYVAQFREIGTVVYDQVQKVGLSSDMLAGDWTINKISLAEFAGKDVYIAFVNENEDQSFIFVDNIEVTHEVDILVSLDNGESVVNKDSQVISGSIMMNNETATYDSIKFILTDANDEVVEEKTIDGLNLKYGDTYKFTFDKALPLTLGIENVFYVSVVADGKTTKMKSAIKNLAFEPTRRVLLEENTGMSCPNCPLGIVSIEKMENDFGSQVVPVALHCFGSDNLGNGVQSVASALGISSTAPIAVIDRKYTAYPGVSVGSEYYIQAPEGSDKLWYDIVQERLTLPADADIDVSNISVADGKMEIEASVKYALDTKDLNINLLAIVLEDNLVGYQSNGMCQVSSSVLGKWGLGGEYAQTRVYPYYFNEVARAYIGYSYQGTSGLIPSSIPAGEVVKATISADVPANISNIDNCRVVVAMINASNGEVVNVAQSKGVTAVENAVDDNVAITTANGAVHVAAQGDALAQVFATDGSLIAQSAFTTAATINVNYTGVAIVKVVTSAGVAIKKVVL